MDGVETQLTADAAVSQLLRFDDGVNSADADVQEMRNFFDGQKFRKTDYRRDCRVMLLTHDIEISRPYLAQRESPSRGLQQDSVVSVTSPV